MPLLKDTSGIGSYYQIIPLNESDYPRDHPAKSTCLGCRRIDSEIVYPWDSGGRFRMSDDIWNGQSIFYLGGTLHVVVTDEVKESLLRMSPTNVNISDASEGDSRRDLSTG